MKHLKKILIRTAQFLLVLVSLLGLYALAVWLLPYIPVNRDAGKDSSADISIYIKSNGVHTDIVAPMHSSLIDWNTVVPYENTDSKDTAFRYVSFGWGDKGFYLETPEWSDLKASVAFKAMFHLGHSAMHVTFYKNIREGEKCREIKINRRDYERLIAYIKKSFLYDASGKTINIMSKNDGYGADDAFYESPGVYDLFHTCNTWANNGLKAAGQRACLWTALDKGIFYQYK